MSLKFKRLLLLSFLLVLFSLVPVSAQPGSAEDPLVSKKYVDERINALETMIVQNNEASKPDNGDIAPPPNSVLELELTPEIRNELLAEALAGVENVYGDLIRKAAESNSNNAPDNNAANPPYNVPDDNRANPPDDNGYPLQTPPADVPLFEVVFAPGGSVIYLDSSSELILRGGSATVVSGVDGLCDVTSGTDIVNGQEVPYNHLLISPVGDGRGVQVFNDAYFMIKGGYYFA